MHDGDPAEAVAEPGRAPGAGEQLTLAGLADLAVPAGPRGGRGRRRTDRDGVHVEVDEQLPVARVCIDLPVPHLDRPFEYLVPASMSGAARPGTRVKVRFGGQDVDGYLLERAEAAEHEGALAPLRRVVSGEAVLAPAVLRLARAVADRYAGTLADVLRLAVPPRHARVEKEDGGPAGDPAGDPADEVPVADDVPAADDVPVPVSTAWAPYRGGAAFCRHVLAGGAPRAVWSALPGPLGLRWPDAIAQAVAAAVTGGRGALVVLPDARDVERVCAALERVGLGSLGGTGTRGATVARLMADDGPAPRYRAFLAALRGRARVVVGTRAAAFAPVEDLGLVVCWDDGDANLAEPRAPYPHARDVLALRAELEGCAALVGAHGRTADAQALVASGWARDVSGDLPTVRGRVPRVRALTSVELAREGAAAAARLPAPAFRAIRDALADGPVLVQVPRAGYLPVVACARCRTPARCGTCHGPLTLAAADAVPTCGWCGRLATDWRCTECGAGALRSVRVGSERTAEELGRAFPQVTVRVSGARSASGVLSHVPDGPALVVATPGAEPDCDAGYPLAVLLDAAVTTAGTSLRAGEDAVRRWLAAASLVRSAQDGGQVLLVGDAAPRPSQALVRWDPVGLAVRELDERTQLALPPAVRVAAVTGTREAVAAVLARLDLPPAGEVLGPVPVEDADPRGDTLLERDVRAVVRVPRGDGVALARGLHASAMVRSARREGGTVRIQLDPPEVW